MRNAQYPNLNTVSIDSNIFTQTVPLVRSKLPLQILKSIAERKHNNQKNSKSKADPYIANLSKSKQNTQKE